MCLKTPLKIHNQEIKGTYSLKAQKTTEGQEITEAPMISCPNFSVPYVWVYASGVSTISP